MHPASNIHHPASTIVPDATWQFYTFHFSIGFPMNVYVTRPIPQPGIDILEAAGATVTCNPDDRALTREELHEAVQGRDGVLCLLSDRIDADTMDAAGAQCRVFANYAVGFNNIDLDAARARGIRITNTPGVLTDATADMAWALLFGAARRVVESDRFIRTGAWKSWGPMQFISADITGRTLGIVGAGRIGTNMALKSAGFRMKVLYTGRRPNEELETHLGARRVALEELLRESDFVSLHVPLNESTRHLIDDAALRLMKPSAILINTSRGPVVDEKALVAALQRRQIAGAGLDVYEEEPLMAPGLAELDNVVLTPHTSSATLTTRTKMATMAATNLVAVLRGEEPPNPVV
ncbi:MAG: D-glycerate dehydrogenase [Rhodothermales bacterium]